MNLDLISRLILLLAVPTNSRSKRLVLLFRKSSGLKGIITGGPQERRAGTENVKEL
jgi:hypothetical protein